MEKRQDDDGDALGQDLTLWSSFWSAISSDIAALSASESQLAAHSTFTTTRNSDMSGSTVVVTQATSTVYVSTTIISTTFVTVQPPPAPIPQTPSSSSPFSTTHKTIFTTSTHVPDISSSSPSASVSGISFQPLSVATSTSSSLPSANSSSTDSMTGGHSNQSNSQKTAIVAGLSSTIAGLFIIGLLVCLILHIRRKRNEPKEIDDDATAEKGGFRPALRRKWTRLANGMGSPNPPPPSTATASPVIDEENRIIRMNTRHWPRPFAPGAGEGYRESVHQGTLRVVNPDAPSRPGTPRHKSYPDANIQRLQRSALTGFVMGAGPRPPTRRSSRQALTTTTYHQTIPTIRVINPALSHEWLATGPTATATTTTATPSFQSYPNDSLVSLPIITRHHPPEDPFYTSSSPPSSSPQPTAESPSIPRLKSTDRQNPQKKPSPTTTTLASGGRTWRTTTTSLTSHLLHPFRGRGGGGGTTQSSSSSFSSFSPSSSYSPRTPPLPPPPQQSSSQPAPTDEAAPSPSIGGNYASFPSPSSFSSPRPSPRPSRRSDPFDLSVRGSTVFQYPWGG